MYIFASSLVQPGFVHDEEAILDTIEDLYNLQLHFVALLSARIYIIFGYLLSKKGVITCQKTLLRTSS